MTQLIKYEAACRALAACKTYSEVMALREQMLFQMFFYKLLKDKEQQVDASVVVLRCEQQVGEDISRMVV